MKVLITGGYGFIGSYVAEKFYREGFAVCIIDNLSSGKQGDIQFRHKSFILDVRSPKCEEVFKANQFEIVIHLAGSNDIVQSIHSPNNESVQSLPGLTNMLALSTKYGVKRFINISSSAVYGEMRNKADESTSCQPISPYGMNKAVGEYFCEKWLKEYNLETLSLRLSNVFGERLSMKNHLGIDVISEFYKRSFNRRNPIIYGDGTQTRDFLYVSDATEAIYRAAMCDQTGILTISSNRSTSLLELLSLFQNVSKEEPIFKESRPGEIQHSTLDNRLAIRVLDWFPKYTLEEGLAKTTEIYVNEFQKQKVTGKEDTKKVYDYRTIFKSVPIILPFIENFFVFVFLIFLEVKFAFTFSGFDLKIIYILIIGLLFGRVQALLACGLTLGLATYQNLLQGKDIIAFFYENEILVQFASYVFIALVIGYIMDKRKILEERALNELHAVEQKYELLKDIYEETKDVKDELQNQILYTEDSFGKVTTIIKQLDNLETLVEIYHGGIQTIEKFIKPDGVSIYGTYEDSEYLRLLSRSRGSSPILANSVHIRSNLQLTEVVKKKVFYFNENLDPSLPILMAPIVVEGKTVAVVCIDHLKFDRLSLHYHNLFRVIIELLSSSVTRALKYMHSTWQERYLTQTIILKPSYFANILASFENARKQYNLPYTILEVVNSENKKELSVQLASFLRQTDVCGIDRNSRLFVILYNVELNDSHQIIQRLDHVGVHTKVTGEAEIYV